MSATVLRAGFITTVKDFGRVGYRQIGVSAGGALDPHALRIANLLVGNEPNAAALEVTLGRMRLRFADERLVAWCGGPFQVELGGVEIPPGRAAVASANEELAVTASERGGKAWLSISGGIDVPLVLGSRSTDLRSGFGGLEGRALRDGDVLELGPSARGATVLAATLRKERVARFGAPRAWAAPRGGSLFLRIVRGADWRRFEPGAVAMLMRGSFTATADSDRMGVRLNGPKLERARTEELVSEAAVPGTIQVPPDGQPIVLLGDCQTLGGYPKIAQVITVDLPIAAQLRPGHEVRFVEVTLADAQRLLTERERDVAWFRAGVELQMR